ncbi:MAG: hypothetical protein DCC68_24305, partial [Planctomycetota bacterium]
MATINPAIGPLLPRNRLARPTVWAALPVMILLAWLTLWNFNNFAPSVFSQFTDWYDINADGLRQV